MRLAYGLRLHLAAVWYLEPQHSTVACCAAGLALLAASYVLNEAAQTGLVRLLPRFKAARIRWRELFFFGTCLHMTATVVALGEAGCMPAKC